MKRLFTAIIFASVLLLVNCNAQPKPETEAVNGPQIEIIGGDTYDWGLISPKDTPLTTDIIIKNTGNETLEIKEVKPACGCTSAPLNKTTLEPGDTTAMHVTLRVGNTASSLTKTIRITSNDPKNTNKIVFLKCTVFHPLQVSPTPYFTFNMMKVGTEAVSKLKISNNTGKDAVITDLEITPEELEVNLKEGMVIKPGQEIELEAKFKPSKAGYFNCSVKMKTGLADQPELFISGYGNVQESSIFNN